MRNLKKFLALALAVMMVFSLMVTANAADTTDDFTDAKDIDEQYEAAMEVMVNLGIMEGRVVDGETVLAPKEDIRRDELALFLYQAANGNKGTDDAYLNELKAYNQFSDLGSANDWALPYINYAAIKGWINGDGKGHFFPAVTVSSYDVMLAMLHVMGLGEDISGSNWKIETAELAVDTGLNDNLTGFPSSLQRQAVAQLVVNALVYTPAAAKTGKYVVEGTANGDYNDELEGESYGSFLEAFLIAQEVLSDLTYGVDYNIKEEVDVEQTLGYKYGLTLVSGVDAMGNPTKEYQVNGTKVAAIADKTVKTATTVVKALGGSTRATNQTVSNLVYAANGNATIAAANTIVYINGEEADENDDTKLGDVVTVSINADKVATVSIKRYSSTKLSADPVTSGEGDKMTVRVPGVVSTATSVSKVEGWEDLAKGDVVYWYMDSEGVYHIALAEYFTGKLTSATGTDRSATYTIGGSNYQINNNVVAGNTNKIATSSTSRFAEWTYYVDDNNFIVYVSDPIKEDGDPAVSGNFVVLQELKFVSGSNIGADKYVEGRIVHMDGTTEIVTVKKIVVDGTTYTGSADATGGNVTKALHNGINALGTGVAAAAVNTTFFKWNSNTGTLTEVTDSDGAVDTVSCDTGAVVIDTNKSAITLNGANNVTVNNNTVFVVAKKDATTNEFDFKSFNVYVGNGNVPKITIASGATYQSIFGAGVTNAAVKLAVVVLKNANGVAQYVYVPAWSQNEGATSGDKIYVISKVANSTKLTEDGTLANYRVIVNGTESKTITVNESTSNNGSALSVNTIYKPVYDENGVMIAKSGTTETPTYHGYKYAIDGGLLMYAGTSQDQATLNSIPCTEDVPAFVVNGTTVSAMTVGELEDDLNDEIYVVKKGSGDDETADYVVIYKQSNDSGRMSLTANYLAWMGYNTGDYAGVAAKAVADKWIVIQVINEYEMIKDVAVTITPLKSDNKTLMTAAEASAGDLKIVSIETLNVNWAANTAHARFIIPGNDYRTPAEFGMGAANPFPVGQKFNLTVKVTTESGTVSTIVNDTIEFKNDNGKIVLK